MGCFAVLGTSDYSRPARCDDTATFFPSTGTHIMTQSLRGIIAFVLDIGK